MNITKTKTESTLNIALEGRLDTTTAPELEVVIRSELEGITSLCIDMKELQYISSAGLRVLLAAQKIMNKQGSMEIVNANDEIKEVFDVTGFMDILTVR